MESERLFPYHATSQFVKVDNKNMVTRRRIYNRSVQRDPQPGPGLLKFSRKQ